MNISGKVFPDFKCELLNVNEANAQIRLENKNIQILVNDGTDEYWVNASSLKSVKEARELLIEKMIFELHWQREKVGMSKAELKRQLIKYMVISK